MRINLFRILEKNITKSTEQWSAIVMKELPHLNKLIKKVGTSIKQCDVADAQIENYCWWQASRFHKA